MTEQKRSAVVILKHPEKGYLGISRKDNHKDFGHIGGKIEPGENPREGLIRELGEEAGLTSDHYSDLKEHAVVPSGNYNVHVFSADLKTEGLPSKQEGEGIMKFLPSLEHFEDSPTFGGLNKVIHKKLSPDNTKKANDILDLLEKVHDMNSFIKARP